LGSGQKYPRAIARNHDTVRRTAAGGKLQFLANLPVRHINDHQTAIIFHVQSSTIGRQHQVNRATGKFQ
jgi:hypothetical protein